MKVVYLAYEAGQKESKIKKKFIKDSMILVLQRMAQNIQEVVEGGRDNKLKEGRVNTRKGKLLGQPEVMRKKKKD